MNKLKSNKIKEENSSIDLIKNETEDKSEKLQKGQKNGLYAALGVCLVSVAAAAIVTYTGFKGLDTVPVETSDTNIVSESENDDPLISGKHKVSESVSQDEKVTEGLVDHEGDENSALLTEEPLVEETKEDNTEEISETSITVVSSEEVSLPEETLEVMSFSIKDKNIINDYNENLSYNETMRDYRTHNGIDIKMDAGEKILSLEKGKVKGVYKDVLLNNVVVIEHGEYAFYYCGLGDEILVNPGDIVESGSEIGFIENVPFEKNLESHLHLEVKKDSAYIDPEEILK